MELILFSIALDSWTQQRQNAQNQCENLNLQLQSCYICQQVFVLFLAAI